MNKILVAHSKGYEVTKEGKVIGVLGNELKLNNHDGYYRFNFRNLNGQSTYVKVHRLQAYQKFGDKMFKEGILVRHLDGNPTNNSWDNIEIGTNSDNMMDISPDIRLAKAMHATSFTRKYDKETVRAYYNENKSYKQTMEHFNISSKGTLHFILNK
jgi:hypothetical protein